AQISMSTSAVLAESPVTSAVTPIEPPWSLELGATDDVAANVGSGAAVAVGAGVGVEFGAVDCVAPGVGVPPGMAVGAGVALGGAAAAFTARVAADGVIPKRLFQPCEYALRVTPYVPSAAAFGTDHEMGYERCSPAAKLSLRNHFWNVRVAPPGE